LPFVVVDGHTGSKLGFFPLYLRFFPLVSQVLGATLIPQRDERIITSDCDVKAKEWGSCSSSCIWAVVLPERHSEADFFLKGLLELI
jgi:hypothetical protein